MNFLQNPWSVGIGLILLSEAVVLWKLRPEEQFWADQPLLQLDIAGLGKRSGGETGEFEQTASSENVISYEFQERPEGLTSAVEQLSFSKGLCGVFVADRASRTAPILELFYFEYESGSPRFVDDVFGHAPEVCMSATGAVLKQAHGTKELSLEGSALPVRVLEFTTPLSDRAMWIFKLTWVPEIASIQPSDTASSLRREKILAGLFRQARPPARVILVGGRNFASLADAWAAFEELVATNLYFSEARNDLPTRNASLTRIGSHSGPKFALID